LTAQTQLPYYSHPINVYKGYSFFSLLLFYARAEFRVDARVHSRYVYPF